MKIFICNIGISYNFKYNIRPYNEDLAFHTVLMTILAKVGKPSNYIFVVCV